MFCKYLFDVQYEQIRVCHYQQIVLFELMMLSILKYNDKQLLLKQDIKLIMFFNASFNT